MLDHKEIMAIIKKIQVKRGNKRDGISYDTEESLRQAFLHACNKKGKDSA